MKQDESFDRTASHMAGEYVSNTEPVAWIDPRELDMAVSTSVTKNKQFDTDIPLYTHQYEKPHNTVLVPCDKLAEMQNRIAELEKYLGFKNSGYDIISANVIPAKTLTDEEIKDFIATFPIIFTPDDLVIFARAILRKAQEK